MRPFLKITSPDVPPERAARIGKLVVFSGVEAGVGKALCTASVATRLARRWRCLAIELDNRSNLQTFLTLKPGERKLPASAEDIATSIEHLKIKTAVPNLDFVGWAGRVPTVDRLLNCLRSDPADYVVASLAATGSEESLDLFAAADVSVIVTHPEGSAEKVFEFLKSFASRTSRESTVYILLNQIRRGGEEKEAAALVERAQANLNLKVSILGSAVYDPQAASGFLYSGSIASFDDIALKIERLLPRTPTGAATSQPAEHRSKKKARIGFIGRLKAPFGRKRREFEEKIQRRDQLIASLQQRHESMMDDLQNMLRQKNVEIADKDENIERLELEVRRYTEQALEGTKRAAELDAAATARRAELDRAIKQIRQIEQANVLLAGEKTTLNQEARALSVQLAEREATMKVLEGTLRDLEATIHSQRGELHDLGIQVRRLRDSNGLLLEQNGTLQSQNETIQTERDQAKQRFEEALMEKTRQMSSLEDHIARLEHSRDSLSDAKAAADSAVRELREKLGDQMKWAGEFENSNRALSAANADAQQALTALKEQLCEKLQNITGLEEQIAELHKSNHMLASSKSEAEIALHGLTEQLSGKLQHIAGLEDRIGGLHESNNTLAFAKAEVEIALNGVTEQLDDKVRALAELQGRSAEQQNYVHRLENQIRQIQEYNNVLSAEKAERDLTLRDLTQQLAEKMESLGQLEARFGSQQDDLHQLEQQIREARESNETLATAKGESDTVIAGLMQRLTEKTEDLSQLEERLVGQQNSLLELQNQILGLEETRSALARKVDDKRDAVTGLNRQLLDKEKCIQELDSRVVTQRAHFQNLRDQIHRFDEWNRALEEEKVKLRNELEAVEIARDEIRTRLVEAEAHIRERNDLIESKDVLLRELGQRLAGVSSENAAVAARATEGLEQLYAELHLHREESRATVERWHDLVSGMEKQTRAVTTQAHDSLLQKDAVIRQVEETYQQQLLGLRKLHEEKDAAIELLEKALRLVEEDNSQLKIHLAGALESSAIPSAPSILLRQRETLIRILRAENGPAATIIGIQEAGKPAFEFGIEMRSILESAGWNIKFMTSSFNNGVFYGLQLLTDGSESADSAAHFLSGALNHAGIPFVSKTVPAPRPLSPFRIVVGQSNW